MKSTNSRYGDHCFFNGRNLFSIVKGFTEGPATSDRQIRRLGKRISEVVIAGSMEIC
jgi:hypothetical protein